MASTRLKLACTCQHRGKGVCGLPFGTLHVHGPDPAQIFLEVRSHHFGDTHVNMESLADILARAAQALAETEALPAEAA